MNARTWILAGLLALFATPAWAQYQECPNPTSTPENLFDLIVDEADVAFGDLSDGTCNGIVNQAKAACRSQVKAAASCLKRSVDAVYDINVRQCNTLESEARSECKQAVKTDRDETRDLIKEAKEDGLEVCDDEFVVFLGDQCEGSLPK